MNSLLDTNGYSQYTRGEKLILDYLADCDTIIMSSVVLGELYAGFFGGSKTEQNIDRLQEFLKLDDVKIISASQITAKIFGRIKYELKKKGQMIPLNDIWIAAHAIETESMLITYDAHFKHIENLKLWREI
jgi:tRNA(fMet)-specific endonuclease VapC